MLDGFVIEGYIVDQTPLKTEQVKASLLKKHALTIIFSVLVHLCLALLLFFIAEKPQPLQVKNNNKAIKSYLYKMPAKPLLIKPIKSEAVKPETVIPIKTTREKVKKTKIETQSKEIKKEKNTEINAATSTRALLAEPSKNTSQTTFSSYQQFDNLRNAINARIRAEELSKLQQFRSPSVMHGDQIPVPHSTQQLTSEQEREKNTTKVSDDISITKYDNGVCTIERKQLLGSPVEGSTAAFACGESKFDKSFREHMKKVQEKIMPQR